MGFSSALSFTVDVPKEYARVAPGEEVYFEIKVLYPENLVRKDLILEYSLLDEEGEVIARSDTLRAIETQLSLLDSVVVPLNAGFGLYNVRVRISDYEGLSEEASASFDVLRKGVDWAYVLVGVVFFGVVVYLGLKFKRYWNMFWIRIKVKEIVWDRFKEEER